MPVATSWAAPLDLNECFLMAVRRSESLQIMEEEVNQAAARYRQILGGVLPHVTFKASEMIQHVPESDVAANPGSISSTFIRRSTPYTAFNLTQPIFSGFKEFRAMSGGRANQLRHQSRMNYVQLLVAAGMIPTLE